MAKKRSTIAKVSKKPLAVTAKRVTPSLLADIKQLINSSRQRIAVAVNADLSAMYWQIGNRIQKDVLGNERAEYGKQILHTLCAKLSWSHIRILIYIDDSLARDFYVEMARLERWSVRTLQERINTMLFERTAISKKPQDLIAKELSTLKQTGGLSPDLIFSDPYVLDFLGLHDAYSEKDVESAITRELERFILELGTDFAFVARQKRFSIDGEDYYLDLLFYHRRLRRLVAIDLKLGKFQAADKGQMELYLRWLDKHERQPEENEPIGLILCAGKSTEHVELLQLQHTGIRVAQYMTELPPRALLERKLHDAIRLARHRLAAKFPVD